MKPSAIGYVSDASGCPTVRAEIVSAACVRVDAVDAEAAPDDHLAASQDYRVLEAGSGRVGDAGGRPTVRAGIVSTPVFHVAAVTLSAPYDHFAAGPDCRVKKSGIGCATDARGCPSIIDASTRAF